VASKRPSSSRLAASRRGTHYAGLSVAKHTLRYPRVLLALTSLTRQRRRLLRYERGPFQCVSYWPGTNGSDRLRWNHNFPLLTPMEPKRTRMEAESRSKNTEIFPGLDSYPTGNDSRVVSIPLPSWPSPVAVSGLSASGLACPYDRGGPNDLSPGFRFRPVVDLLPS
jgi:hypothetical protein